MDEIGLFPLGLVLLPTEQVPLHIFEPRYRELITECVDEERPFGLVYADDDGIRQVGTLATVVEVTDRFEDGRLNIVVEGGDRFKLRRADPGPQLPDRNRGARRRPGRPTLAGRRPAGARALRATRRADGRRRRVAGGGRRAAVLRDRLALRARRGAEARADRGDERAAVGCSGSARSSRPSPPRSSASARSPSVPPRTATCRRSESSPAGFGEAESCGDRRLRRGRP